MKQQPFAQPLPVLDGSKAGFRVLDGSKAENDGLDSTVPVQVHHLTWSGLGLGFRVAACPCAQSGPWLPGPNGRPRTL